MLNQSGLKKILSHKLLLLLLFLVTGSCSTEKNTALSRSYHNVTSRYNIYFNGKESLLAGLQRIDQSVEDDYTRLLPIYKTSISGTERMASAEMDNAILKASKLIKVHSLTQKPKRRKNRTAAYKNLASKDEYNNWVDDSYILMGKAYFYQKKYPQAMDNFDYVLRKFPDKTSHFDALLGLIRCYAELERFSEAQEIIKEIDASMDFPKRLEQDFALAVADFHLKQHDYEEAIPALKTALSRPLPKAEKARYNYILAQLYQQTGQTRQSIERYMQVAKHSASYKMAFNARINAFSLHTETVDPVKLRKTLNQMLADEKNEEFRDQIYFALAKIDTWEGQEQAAIANYRQSSAVSNSNDYQKALSCLTLADLYFERQYYTDSRAYYDSAMLVIDESYPNYPFIRERHKSLVLLTDNLLTIEREDSLQSLALLNEVQRNQKIDSWIKAERDAELQRKQNENQEQMDRNFYRMNQSRLGLSQTQQGSGWYFYNPSTVTLGKIDFEQKWGKRKLEDNWRRKNRNQTTADLNTDELADTATEPGKTENTIPRVNDRMNREYYLQDLPLTPEAMSASNIRVRDALFSAGRIFKTDYQNYPMSIAEYEDLLRRYPNNIYQLSSYFELWDLYAKTGNRSQSDYYRNLIIGRYPDSNYAQYLVNPNYFIEREAHNDSINRMYQRAFAQFREGNYAQAGQTAGQIRRLKPDSTLVPRIAFMETIAQGEKAGFSQFGKLLDNYMAEYPASPVKPMAAQIRQLIADSTLMDYQKLIASGYLNSEIVNDELLVSNKVQDEFNGKFSYDEELLHYFVIAFDRSSKVDVNRLKFDIANYNIDHYTKTDFDIELEYLDANTALLGVRSLQNKEDALIYFRSIIRKREVYQSLRDVNYTNFVVSTYNYRELKVDHNTDDYLKFFLKNYSRFIGGDFPADELPEPEELMANAREAELEPEERGSFVLVKPENKSEQYSRTPEAAHQFVIAVKDATFNLKGLQNRFGNFNRTEFGQLALSSSQKNFGEYSLLLIGSLSSAEQAMDYFRRVITNRELFSELGDRSYRNFIISDENLATLLNSASPDTYLDFFRSYYLSGQASQTVPAAVAEKPLEQGPFVADKNGTHAFVLFVPATGFDKEQLLTAIKQQTETTGLQPEVLNFDPEHLLIRVSPFSQANEAMSYLKTLVRKQSVYAPLSELDYRNFIISEKNLTLLLQNKDLTGYLNLYKALYLGN